MPEPVTLTTILIAGAAAAGGAAVGEATKDAYRALKSGVVDLFGKRAGDAADKLESEATREEGKALLATAVPDLREDEAAEISPLAEALWQRLQEDAEARKAAAAADLYLDLEAAGGIRLARIQGAQTVKVRARAGEDISLEDLHLGRRDPEGN